MLKRDLIMVMIEELGKAIAQMTLNRNNNDGGKNPPLIESVYTSLKLDPGCLLSATPEQLRELLNQEDGCGLERMELAAKTLIEEAYLHPETAPALRSKAKELLEYIQANDTTFSLERMALLAGL